jgi:hypothetical protein
MMALDLVGDRSAPDAGTSLYGWYQAGFQCHPGFGFRFQQIQMALASGEKWRGF